MKYLTSGTVLTNWSKIQSTGIKVLRKLKPRHFRVKSGWHLASFGTAADVYYDFSHNYESLPSIATLEKVTDNITNGIHSGTVNSSVALEVVSSHAEGSIPPTLAA